jgi:hypothetical protein
MVAIKRITQFMIITSLLFLSQACIKRELEIITTIEEEIQNIYSGFEFKTINEYDINLRFFSDQNQPIDGVYVELFTSNPLNNIGTLTTERKKQRIFAGNSNTDGILNFKISIPSFSDSLYVLTYYIGLPTIKGIKLSSEFIQLDIGGQFSSNNSKSALKVKAGTIPTPSLVNGYYVLGSWNIYGVPDYLESVNDVISTDFLNDVNTFPENPYGTPDTLFINIDFVNPVAFNNIGTPPYNPFIIIDRNRGVEVHLPNLEPTDLANSDLLGTGDDNSDIASGKYNVSDIYLPWAINLPESFDYPSGKQDITQTHLMFNPWASSLGYNYMDWYMPKTAYRNSNKIYNH